MAETSGGGGGGVGWTEPAVYPQPRGTSSSNGSSGTKAPQTTPKSSPKFPKRSWGIGGLGSPKLWSKMTHSSGAAAAASPAGAAADAGSAIASPILSLNSRANSKNEVFFYITENGIS